MFDQSLVGVATSLARYCREGKESEGLKALYDRDCVSVEALAMGEAGRKAKGLDAIRGKHEWWFGAHDIHENKVEGPFLHGADRFSLIFDIDVTNRQSGERARMREVAIYTVAGGKIVREEFYYPAE